MERSGSPVPWGRLFRITPDSVGAEYDGQPNGLKFLKDARGLIDPRKASP